MRSQQLEHIAIPYYGNIARPGRGFEKVYFFVKACTITRRIDTVQMLVWAGSNLEELVEWFSSQGISVVISDKSNAHLQLAFEKADIASYWGVRGDVTDVVKNYLGARVAA